MINDNHNNHHSNSINHSSSLHSNYATNEDDDEDMDGGGGEVMDSNTTNATNVMNTTNATNSANNASSSSHGHGNVPLTPQVVRKSKKLKKKNRAKQTQNASHQPNQPQPEVKDEADPKKKKLKSRKASVPEGLSPAQQAVQEQLRLALEEDQYSSVGSIVDTESDEDDSFFCYRGQAVRLDKAFVQQTVRKLNAQERSAWSSCHLPPLGDADFGEDDEHEATDSGGAKRVGKAKRKKKRKDEVSQLDDAKPPAGMMTSLSTCKDPFQLVECDEELDRDGSSIFGATAGSTSSTWVECDKCKKWRRLRGVVDEKKLPSKWFCSMNKNDPDRARCSAPEEEYESSHTPESAADARIRKHLRVWVRRLQCNELFEARLPSLAAKCKKKPSFLSTSNYSNNPSNTTNNTTNNNANSSSTDPLEWVRCCNPSCGKWRSILRIMDAKEHVIDRANNGEWFCVMNTWDEKMASCAAPQENLPAIGCPPWVIQDETALVKSAKA